MMLQLDPPLPVDTPKGKALAHVLIDPGVEHDLLWVCFQDNGECWTWRNPEIRAQSNITMGRTPKPDLQRTAREMRPRDPWIIANMPCGGKGTTSWAW